MIWQPRKNSYYLTISNRLPPAQGISSLLGWALPGPASPTRRQSLPAAVLGWLGYNWRCSVITSVLDLAAVHKGCCAACSMTLLGCRIGCTPCQCIKPFVHVFWHLQHGSTELDKAGSMVQAAGSM